ncbi:hypothetical protein C4K68_04945 [Pokkaliibacter plantistimulans]|uniref:Flagellar hook-length control protein-like C-terminal domain-containing protein n=1 Tax=Proteobacteria bacterium 228 TaxID=2083153 RepID=A0A2S5KU66_9PROT|nr:hypothetical protein C4K68_04945 [Pokkaliibacter plantistimulans]
MAKASITTPAQLPETSAEVGDATVADDFQTSGSTWPPNTGAKVVGIESGNERQAMPAASSVGTAIDDSSTLTDSGTDSGGAHEGSRQGKGAGSSSFDGLDPGATGASALDKAQVQDFKSALTSASQNPATGSGVLTGKPDTEQWATQLNRQLQVLNQQGVQTADLHLDQQGLGSLQVRIHIQHDQASIVFQSTSPQVRDALESHIQRLKDGFAEQGLNLGSVDVRDNSSQSQEQSYQPKTSSGYRGEMVEGDGDVIAPVTESTAVSTDRLVDYYA